MNYKTYPDYLKAKINWCQAMYELSGDEVHLKIKYTIEDDLKFYNVYLQGE